MKEYRFQWIDHPLDKEPLELVIRSWDDEERRVVESLKTIFERADRQGDIRHLKIFEVSENFERIDHKETG